jgi:catechol 2,3-dioxygenase-like lactoylglutathione lyase family enzyme/uncharacterized protein YndB with AHSA1/START domain
MSAVPLCQVAFSVTDLRRTHAWYRDMFGFLPSGGTRLFRGPLTSRVQGLPNAASTCWWMVDQQDFFQLEMFQFSSPLARPRPADWRPCDVGYTMVGLHVIDFDATLERLARSGVRPLSAPLGPAGARRVCVRDPEGVLLELMEEDVRHPAAPLRPRPEVPVATRSVTVSVGDLERSQKFFGGILGLPEARGVTLHGPEHEALWGLDGAKRRSKLLWAGDFLVELVQYMDPLGKPWPDGYRISDQGLLNIAFGFRSKTHFDEVYQRCVAAGHHGNWHPFNLGPGSVVYVNDDQGFSVELLFVRPWFDGPAGFKAPAAIVAETHVAAPRDVVWKVLTDHEGMAEWSPFREVTLVREGEAERNGVGAVRRMRAPGVALEEQVVRWMPPARYDYRLVAGAPIRDHAGCVMLRSVGDETEVTWIVRLNPIVPGTGPVIRAGLQRGLNAILRRLKQRLEAAA